MIRILGATALACFVATSAFAADFAGSYVVTGRSPGESAKYEGVVRIKKTGQATYEVTWTIGKDKFVGTGIGSPDGLAVAYKSGSNTGIAIYSVEKSGEITGYWTYAGGTDIGEETWSER